MKKYILTLIAAIQACLGMAACSPEGSNEPNTTEESMNKIEIAVNGHTLSATLADNSSARALVELLRQGNVTVNAHDYGGFEKVGSLPQSLPQNNQQITTSAGDIILYQGSSICFYYSVNSWNFTRLGRVDGAENLDLAEIYGDGDATFVLSMPRATVATVTTSNVVKTSIYTTSGELLAQTSIDGLPSGIYIVRQTLADGSTTSRKINI